MEDSDKSELQATEETYNPDNPNAYTRSIELQKLALNELPEGTSTNARAASGYAPYPQIFVDSGSGSKITDVDGNEYIDYLLGYSSIIRGHAQTDEIDAARNQLEKGTMFGTASELEYETAKEMNDILPKHDWTKFTNSGTEATMHCIRAARAYTGKDKIIKFEGFYHGHHDYVAVSFRPMTSDLGPRRNPVKFPMGAGIPDKTLETVEVFPWNDIGLLEEKFEREGDNIAGVITEAYAGNGGLFRPEEGYLEEVQDLAHDHGSLFILDEVVTGFRLDLEGAQGYEDLEPDLSSWGKSMANGFPASAVTGKDHVKETVFGGPGSDHAPFYGTYTGNPLALSGTKANLEALKNDIGKSGYREFRKRGRKLTDGLQEIGQDEGHDIWVPEFAGYFFMHFHDGESNPDKWTEWRDVAAHIDPDKYTDFARKMIGNGSYFIPFIGRINLSHSHTDEDIEQTLEAAKAAFADIPT